MVPETRTERYRGAVGKDLLLGLRPEHITETRGRENGVGQEFSITLDVVEPMGMETMVFFTIDGTESAAALSRRLPRTQAKPCSYAPISITCI